MRIYGQKPKNVQANKLKNGVFFERFATDFYKKDRRTRYFRKNSMPLVAKPPKAAQLDKIKMMEDSYE